MSETFTGNQGLRIEEPLIFELDSPGQSAVDLPEPPAVKSRLGEAGGRPPLSAYQPEELRH